MSDFFTVTDPKAQAVIDRLLQDLALERAEHKGIRELLSDAAGYVSDCAEQSSHARALFASIERALGGPR